MDDTGKSDAGGHRATTGNHRDRRAAALQKALRDNLRRRKAAAVAEPPGAGQPAPNGLADKGETT